ncbi:MAG: CNP1-like family protein [Pseudomonadota bacterium]|nr:CNP1-like family protein [Pseudomonadota bacterium]MDP1903096.1 CNP1-like family protein [Pseudomonadota bacterium]MDP2353086.1 CNP1-like family protein [Pseudomonadota bacterium]
MRPLFTLLITLLALSSHAAENPLIWGENNNWNQFEYEFDDTTKWQELQHQLPPYPKAENFIPITLGARSSNQFFVDYASVTASDDGVVRYGMVIKSPSGAETVSFEGMRCTSGERKLYAFGRSDGKGGGEWSRNRYAKWEPIRGRSLNDFRRELFHHYFCTVEGAVKLPAIQRNLKSGGTYSRD